MNVWAFVFGVLVMVVATIAAFTGEWVFNEATLFVVIGGAVVSLALRQRRCP